MSFRKCVAGAGFEVYLKSISLLIVAESDSDNNLPRFELCSMRRLAGIMFVDAFIQIRCYSNVSSIRVGNALKKVYISHITGGLPQILTKKKPCFAKASQGILHSPFGAMEDGGGGTRTPVPRCFTTSIYVHSRSIEAFTSFGAERQAPKSISSEFVLSLGPEQPSGAACFCDALSRSADKNKKDGLLIKQPDDIG